MTAGEGLRIGEPIEVKPDVSFEDLLEAWPKEPLYWKEEPPVPPQKLMLAENLYEEIFNKKRKKKTEQL